MADTSLTTTNPIRILIVAKNNGDAFEIVEQARRTAHPINIYQAFTKEQCLKLLNAHAPHLVIADYDFGVFPFVNELREKKPETPFVIISELELEQNSPKRGLNIYVLKADIARIPRWIEALNTAGLFIEGRRDNLAQIKSFLKAIERLPIAASENETETKGSPTREAQHGNAAKDPLQQWTAELEKKMGDTAILKAKSSRIDPLLSSGI